MAHRLSTPTNKRKALLERFASHIELDHGSRCWIWIGQFYVNGYGRFFYRGRYQKAHRVSWMLFRGEIPAGAMLCHRCDVRACVNPAHLYVGDHLSNMADHMNRGEGKIGTPTALEIRRRFRAGENRTHLAAEYGLTRPGLYKLVRRKTLPD